jgi:hypothetical protein
MNVKRERPLNGVTNGKFHKNIYFTCDIRISNGNYSLLIERKKLTWKYKVCSCMPLNLESDVEVASDQLDSFQKPSGVG